MRRGKKPVVFIVVAFIAIFAYLTLAGIATYNGDFKKTYIKGSDDIRWGIDIKGGVDVTFSPADGYDASNDEMDSVKTIMESRLTKLGITDNELYVDYDNQRVIIRFPWKSDEVDFDPQEAVKELGETARLTFREHYNVDSSGMPQEETLNNIIVEGKDVEKAEAVYLKSESDNSYEFQVKIDFTDEGSEKFKEATAKMYENHEIISIWMDDQCISYPSVNSEISSGTAYITGSFTADEAKNLADKINAGALPFKLETSSLNVISPTDGENAKDSMILAGIIAFIAVAIYIIVLYRLPGIVAVIALAGQVIGSIAAITGFFGDANGFTLTIPGIAGIILSVGMGVDANIITTERIKEELNKGKTLDGSLQIGFQRGFTAIFDGNVTAIIVAVILMGAFGSPDSFFSKIFNAIFFMFGPSTTGMVYSFGYTLLVGVICNFIFGVLCSRLMLSSLSRFKAFRNPKLYGGKDHE